MRSESTGLSSFWNRGSRYTTPVRTTFPTKTARRWHPHGRTTSASRWSMARLTCPRSTSSCAALVDGGPYAERTSHAACHNDNTDGRHVARRSSAPTHGMMKQCLARGIHGILLCHAETPGAVSAFVESCRYPFQTIGVGRRRAGRGTQRRRRAARRGAYMGRRSRRVYEDRGPLAAQSLTASCSWGLKLENKRSLAKCEASAAVPGIAFAEWGPGDMGLSFGYADAHDPPYPDDMEAARLRIKAACDAAGIAFLCSWSDFTISVEDRVNRLMGDGVKILSGVGEEGAAIGRKITGRTMAV